MKNKLIYSGIVAALILIAGASYIIYSRTDAGVFLLTRHLPNPATPVCPDDYADDSAGRNAYTMAMVKWMNDFIVAHPGAATSTVLAARYQYLLNNHCTQAVERFQETMREQEDASITGQPQGGMQETAAKGSAPTPAASSSSDDFYALSSEERDGFLFSMNEEKEYQVVVNATDDGIQHHRDVIWNDVAFWDHRGRALYELGDCFQALTAFYHAITRDPQDAVANAFMRSIDIDHCGAAASTTTSTASETRS